MRWEALVMVVILGAINLIGRWLAARAERTKREATFLPAGETRTPTATPKPGIERRSEVVRAPRAPRAQTATAGRREVPGPSVQLPKPRKPAVSGPSREALLGAAAVAPDSKARRSARRWSAKAVRQAFIASEILAKPASLRT